MPLMVYAAYLVHSPSLAKVDHLIAGEKYAPAEAMLTKIASDGNIEANAWLGDLLLQSKNYHEAIKHLKLAADEGHLNSLVLLGNTLYRDNYYKDERLGLQYLQKAADMRHMPSMVTVGRAYCEGVYVTRNMQLAMRYLEPAMAQGNRVAQYYMGRAYLRGDGLPRDIGKGVDLLEKAATQGSTDAKFLLGRHYGKGDAAYRDYPKAVAYFESIAGGHYGLNVKPDLAVAYYRGLGCNKDIEKAVRFASDVLAEQPNNLDALYVFGAAIVHGGVPDRTVDEGHRYLLAASEGGNMFAAAEIAQFLYNDFLRTGNKESLSTALKQMEKVNVDEVNGANVLLGIIHYRLEQGGQSGRRAYEYLKNENLSGDPEAKAVLGHLCLTLPGLENDRQRGLKLLDDAAREDNILAAGILGMAYVTGDSVEKNETLAREYFGMAASHNVPEARLWLGKIAYLQGDYDQAGDEFLAALNTGQTEANLWLGKLAFLGKSPVVDPAMAVAYLTSASRYLDDEARGMLAKCYYFGKGIQRDLGKAAEYIRLTNIDDDDLKLIAGDLKYHSLDGAKSEKEEGRAYLEELSQKGYAPAQTLLGIICLEDDQNPARAVQLFQSALDGGDVAASYRLGRMWHEGIGVARDDEKALRALRRADENGDGNATALLGRMYRNGDGVERNYPTALEYLERAVEAGSFEAMFDLGGMYYLGQGTGHDMNKAADLLAAPAGKEIDGADMLYAKALIDQNHLPAPRYDLAEQHLQRAAGRGDIEAKRLLGDIYLKGKIAGKFNTELGERYLIAASEAGDLDATHILSDAYEKGELQEKGSADRAAITSRLAESGDVAALLAMGRAYLDGQGVQKDAVRAARYLGDAAEKNNAEAMYLLGNMYLSENGVTRDVKTAMELLQNAWKKGELRAGIPLGNMYFYGEHVGKDVSAAAKYLVPASGYADASAHAALGWLFFYGQGVEQSNTLSMKHLEVAVENHDALAASLLAKIYYDGEIVVEDYVKARSFAEIGMEHKYPLAARILGLIYAEGRDVKKNSSVAKKHLHYAADSGDVEAQYYLGSMYMSRTADNNPDLAYKYLKLATEQGHLEARKLFGRLVR